METFQLKIIFRLSQALCQSKKAKNLWHFIFSVHFQIVYLYPQVIMLHIVDNSRVLLLCQIWIVNYYVKCLSDNLSNKNKNTGVSKIVHFGILIHILSWNIYFRLLRKKTWTENQQLFDGMIDIKLFDGVEVLD